MNMYPHWFAPALFVPGSLYGLGAALVLVLLLALAAWSLVWKGFALWFAARNEQKWWFAALLVLNTLGILDIIYLIWFRNPAPRTPSIFVAPTDVAAASEPEVVAAATPE